MVQVNILLARLSFRGSRPLFFIDLNVPCRHSIPTALLAVRLCQGIAEQFPFVDVRLERSTSNSSCVILVCRSARHIWVSLLKEVLFSLAKKFDHSACFLCTSLVHLANRTSLVQQIRKDISGAGQ